jgi:hypothetical protein
MRCVDEYWLLTAERDCYSDDLCRKVSSQERGRHLFREPLQFIVIAVMSVMSGTFPHTYGFST